MTDQRFPNCGRPWDEIRREMETARRGDLPWRHARIFKPAYFAGEDIVRVANAAHEMYISDNALYGGTSYPSLGRYETEVVAMLLDLLDAPDGAGGSVTAGGTESNMMAVKTARDWARVHRPQAHAPEIVLPRTAHPSFDKAAHMFGVRAVRMAESPGCRADISSMTAAVNDNTVMLVGSAPPYPYGTTDSIVDLSRLAQRRGLWLHVDACIGGFILPFFPISTLRCPALRRSPSTSTSSATPTRVSRLSCCGTRCTRDFSGPPSMRGRRASTRHRASQDRGRAARSPRPGPS
jgi:sphinganine-1-phosphate aldolase